MPSPSRRDQVPDCFERLGLSDRATRKEITEAYHARAAQRHPDTGGSAESFSELEAAYRECLRRAKRRPRGRPSRDHFSPKLPGAPRWDIWRMVLMGGTLAVLVCAAFAPKLALLVGAIWGPFVLGCLIAQLSAGTGLAVASLSLLGLGLGWLAACYRIRWLSYVFATVPSEDGKEFVAAVGPEKQFWFAVALATTAFTVLMIVLGTIAAWGQSQR